MNKTFRIRDDWFQICILPAIRRRNAIAAVICLLSIGCWFYSYSWIFIVVLLLTISERIYENASTANTKSLIDSISIVVSPTGLTMKAKGAESGVYHSWSSLTYKEYASVNPAKNKIVLKSNNGKIKLCGYQDQSSLRDIIHDNVVQS